MESVTHNLHNYKSPLIYLKILFVLHQCFLCKWSGHTSWQTHTHNKQTNIITSLSRVVYLWYKYITSVALYLPMPPQGWVRNNGIKRKPPCIGGMELVSLSCNRVFISAESVGRGWCKIAIATKWYQFHTTDKCGFLFMPWITDRYTFVRYTKLVNKIGIAVTKVITFSIMTA